MTRHVVALGERTGDRRTIRHNSIPAATSSSATGRWTTATCSRPIVSSHGPPAPPPEPAAAARSGPKATWDDEVKCIECPGRHLYRALGPALSAPEVIVTRRSRSVFKAYSGWNSGRRSQITPSGGDVAFEAFST